MIRQVFGVYYLDCQNSIRRRMKRLSSHGRRNILISRLEKHAATSTPTVVSNTTTSQQPDDTRSSLLSEDQSIFTRSVKESVAEIARNAARAAVEAMSNSRPQ